VEHYSSNLEYDCLNCCLQNGQFGHMKNVSSISHHSHMILVLAELLFYKMVNVNISNFKSQKVTYVNLFFKSSTYQHCKIIGNNSIIFILSDHEK